MPEKKFSKAEISDFSRAVYSAVKKIPRGRVVSYAAVARTIGRPKAARAVGQALKRNPFAPAVPCHRVVRSDARLGGFAGGVKRKEILLKQEGVKIANGQIADSKFFIKFK